MKNALSFLSICIIGILGICAFSSLPMDTSSTTKEKYSSWSGVIRIWVCNSQEIDPFAWLNACAADFEKQSDGVYVNVQRVSPAAIVSFTESGINPPDMIVWPAGLLDSADGLHEIAAEYPLREGLNASPYAVPLLTDTHAWIYDSNTLENLPADMYDTPVSCSEADLIAMTALSTGKRSEEGAEIILPGVDLGLSGESAPAAPKAGNIICRASKDLVISDDAAKLFKSGECSATVGNISTIESLCAAGYTACVTGNYAYTGAPVLCSIVQKTATSAAQRRALCEDFLTYLLGAGQEKTHLAGAMPAAAGITAHAGDPVLSYIEAALDGLGCIAPPYFGRHEIPDEVYQFISGKITAEQAIEAMR